jgi:fucose permease
MSGKNNLQGNNKQNTVIALLLASFIMGYIDIIGAAMGYVQKDFSLSEILTKLLPTSVFIWFFLLSVPISVLQKSFGIKRILNIGLLLTGISMFIPIIHYSYASMIISFILLGIGNTILQVTINPMFHLITDQSKYASYLSLSQLIKSLSSLVGPLLTVWIATWLGLWRYTFLIFGLTSGIMAIWFYFIQSPSRIIVNKSGRKNSPFSLLRHRYVTLMVLGIFLIVGLDVGLNTTIFSYFSRLFNLGTNEAVKTISIYFLAKILGTFAGAILLRKINPSVFFKFASAILVIFIVLFIFSGSAVQSKVYLFCIGFFAANIFPLIFSLTIQKFPDYLEELSGLMIMSVSGGAIIPPIMGILSDYFGFRISLSVLLICGIYLVLISNIKVRTIRETAI